MDDADAVGTIFKWCLGIRWADRADAHAARADWDALVQRLCAKWGYVRAVCAAITLIAVLSVMLDVVSVALALALALFASVGIHIYIGYEDADAITRATSAALRAGTLIRIGAPAALAAEAGLPECPTLPAPPPRFVCPITFCCMTDPVVAADGEI